MKGKKVESRHTPHIGAFMAQKGHEGLRAGGLPDDGLLQSADEKSMTIRSCFVHCLNGPGVGLDCSSVTLHATYKLVMGHGGYNPSPAEGAVVRLPMDSGSIRGRRSFTASTTIPGFPSTGHTCSHIPQPLHSSSTT